MDRFYAAVRLVVRFSLWFFFKPVDLRHPERVPAGGPVLLCINHPNNLIDSLIVGAALRRKVHYLATAALFHNPLGARFLRACGAIRVYRKEDDPDKMDPNAEAFAACFRALETWVVGRLSGAAGAAVFALALPLSGLVAYRHLVGAGRLRSRFRLGVLALTRERAARFLVAEREAIIAELERTKVGYLATRGNSS